MSFWKKTMDYLGLGADDAYEDYERSLGDRLAATPPRMTPPGAPS